MMERAYRASQQLDRAYNLITETAELLDEINRRVHKSRVGSVPMRSPPSLVFRALALVNAVVMAVTQTQA
jgi:hypothetical protein